MANSSKESAIICRFCLWQDEKQLQIIANTLNASFKIEDITHFTGIPINSDDAFSCAICFECLSNLKKSTDFRHTCMLNDAAFREFWSATITKEKEEPTSHTQDTDPLEALGNDIIKTEPFDEDSISIPILNASSSQDVTEGVGDLFSANSITKDELTGHETSRYAQESFVGEDEDDRSEKSNYELLDGDPQKAGHKKRSCRNKPRSSGSQSPRIETAEKEMKHKKQNTPSTEGGRCPRVLCSICGKLVTNMSFHKLEHQEKRTKLTCPHCPSQITHQKNLIRHIKTVHLKTVTKTCEICGKEFTTNNSYVAHMDAQHYTGQAFECSICLKKFRHATNLRQHAYAMHNGKRYSCTICDKSFKSSGLLSNHQRVHSTDQPYGCSQCTKRFKSAFARNTHELTHSGILFKCTLCERSYRYKSLLSMHMKKLHSEETLM